MIYRAAAITALLAFALGSSAQADPRSQLERSLRIPQAEAGAYTPLQLALIKRVQDRSDLNDMDRNREIKAIKRGAAPRLNFGF